MSILNDKNNVTIKWWYKNIYMSHSKLFNWCIIIIYLYKTLDGEYLGLNNYNHDKKVQAIWGLYKTIYFYTDTHLAKPDLETIYLTVSFNHSLLNSQALLSAYYTNTKLCIINNGSNHCHLAEGNTVPMWSPAWGRDWDCGLICSPVSRSCAVDATMEEEQEREDRESWRADCGGSRGFWEQDKWLMGILSCWGGLEKLCDSRPAPFFTWSGEWAGCTERNCNCLWWHEKGTNLPKRKKKSQSYDIVYIY